jgi:hypothetical protein
MSPATRPSPRPLRYRRVSRESLSLLDDVSFCLVEVPDCVKRFFMAYLSNERV